MNDLPRQLRRLQAQVAVLEIVLADLLLEKLGSRKAFTETHESLMGALERKGVDLTDNELFVEHKEAVEQLLELAERLQSTAHKLGKGVGPK